MECGKYLLQEYITEKGPKQSIKEIRRMSEVGWKKDKGFKLIEQHVFITHSRKLMKKYKCWSLTFSPLIRSSLNLDYPLWPCI